MEKAALKDILYSSMLELMNNSKYYYHSTISSNYSHWTEPGAAAIVEYTNTMAELMLAAENKDLDQRAKDMVIRGLKGETL